MSGRWENTTDGHSLRFFSPEQVDQILRDGIRRGRQGSHAAIERILKHEPSLERADLWRRIRELKTRPRAAPGRHSSWSSEDDELLRQGYERGGLGKREAIRELVKRHPEWQPHVVWWRARTLGLSRRKIKKGQERRGSPWSEEDDQILLNLAGYKSVRVIAKLLHRSERAVSCRLAVLGKRTRVHFEGFTRRALAEQLHMSRNTIQRLIAEGLLEVRDPRITPQSVKRLFKSGYLEAVAPASEPRA